jgi:hypothetical protein
MEWQHDRRNQMAEGGQGCRHSVVSQGPALERGKAGGGTLGSSCLRVLECLTFDFQNWNTGRLDPGYEDIAAKRGHYTKVL